MSLLRLMELSRKEKKMKVLIYAYEGQYGGLHGMYEVEICEVNNIEEAYTIGEELARNVIDDYDLYDDCFEEEPLYEVYVMSEEYQDLSVEELNNLLIDWEDFVVEYCD